MGKKKSIKKISTKKLCKYGVSPILILFTKLLSLKLLGLDFLQLFQWFLNHQIILPLFIPN